MEMFETATTLSRLAFSLREATGAKAVLVTEVAKPYQFILANAGLTLPADMVRAMPISHSICQHVVAMDFPLLVDDAMTHPLLRGNGAVDQMGVCAYLGAPIRRRDGRPCGAICAIETQPRRWTTEDLSLVLKAARRADDLLYQNV